MKQSIYFQGIPTSGTTYLATYYWNGHEFITGVKAKFAPEVIVDQYKSACAWLDNQNLIVTSKRIIIA